MMVFGVEDIEETAVVRIDGLNMTIGFVEERIGQMFKPGWIGLAEVASRIKIEVIGGRTVFGPDCGIFDAL